MSPSRQRILFAIALLAAVIVLIVTAHRRNAPPAAASQVPSAAAQAQPHAFATPALSSASVDHRARAEQALRNTDRRERTRQFATNFRQWLERDFAGATTFLKTMPAGAERTQALLAAAALLGARDPGAAIALANDLAQTREERVVYNALFASFADLDPRAAAARLAAVPAGEPRQNAVRALAGNWARRDESAALKWALALDPAEKPFAVESVVLDIVSKDPQRAARIAQESLHGAARERILLAAVQQLVKTDAASAAGLVAQINPGETLVHAATEVARALAARDPGSALAWARTLPPGPAAGLATVRALEVWAGTDAAAAGEYVRAMPADRAQHEAAAAVANALGATNANAAIMWAQSLADTETRRIALLNAANAWAQHDAAAAARWVTQQPPETFATLAPTALQAALSYWVLQDSSGARAFVRELPPADQAGSAAFVAPLLAQREPAATLAWAQELADATARDAAVSAAFTRWRQNDASAAATWLATANLAPELKAKLQAAK